MPNTGFAVAALCRMLSIPKRRRTRAMLRCPLPLALMPDAIDRACLIVWGRVSPGALSTVQNSPFDGGELDSVGL